MKEQEEEMMEGFGLRRGLSQVRSMKACREGCSHPEGETGILVIRASRKTTGEETTPGREKEEQSDAKGGYRDVVIEVLANGRSRRIGREGGNPVERELDDGVALG